VTGFPSDARFATNRDRVARHGELKPLLDAQLVTRTRLHWLTALKGAGVPCGSVRDFQELFDDPQVKAREMVTVLEHATIGSLRLLGSPLKLSATPTSVRTPPPRLGEHTEPILLNDLGCSREQIAALRASGVV